MRKFMCFSFLISFILTLFCFSANATAQDNIIINGKQTEISAIEVKNVDYLPVRMVGEFLGYQVGWNNVQRAAELRRDGYRLRIYVDDDKIVSNDGKLLEVDVVLHDDCTYVPLSTLCIFLNLTQNSEYKTDSIYIYDKTQIEPFITDEYPIVFIPGTMGAWSSVDFASLKNDIIKVDGGNSFANATLLVLRPTFISILESIEKMEKNFRSYYVTQVLGKTYYIEPFGDTYAPLFQYMEKNGLIQNKDYFIYGYDTLNVSIEENAKTLDKYIDAILKKTNADKVQIIAHSQGGLVARQYLQELGGTEYTAKFLGVAVPNHGVTYTYPLYTKGSFNPLDGREIFISILSYFAYGDFFDASKMRFVRENFKTIVDMLPTYYDTGDLKNEFLEKLNSKDSISNLDSLGTDNILMVTGSGCSTVASYDLQGKAENVYYGDGTVLIDSARLDGDYTLLLLPDTRHTEGFRLGSPLYYYFDLTE